MRLGRWQKIAIYCSAATVGLSGLLWFVLHELAYDDPGELAHLLLILHGASAYVVLLAVGSLLPVHVRAGWLLRRNLATGLAVIATISVLSITALMLYYGSEEVQTPAKWVHLAFGISVLILFPAHAFVKLNRRERTSAQRDSEFIAPQSAE
jgi:hypothetical protein